MNMEELVNVLNKINEELKKQTLDKLVNISGQLTSIIKCLTYSICNVNIELMSMSANIYIGGISKSVHNDVTLKELTSIVRNTIVENADKIVADILMQFRDVIDELVDKLREQEQDDP
ncbi:MAG: hypothetical protein QXN51_05160 [Ignisphaera sp.]